VSFRSVLETSYGGAVAVRRNTIARWRRTLAAGLVVVAAAAVPSVPEPAGAAPPALPTTGALFGAYVQPGAHTGPDRRSALESFESLVGRPMALERVYYFWNQQWPTPDDEWTRDAGRIPYISWNALRTDGGVTRWADIAAGVYDATLRARAADLIAYAGPVVFSFQHEPENDAEAGTAAEFIAAFRHVRAVFEDAGVTNATYAWTMMAWSFRLGRAAPFYPGDDVVDVIASDGYNWYGCPRGNDPWRSFTEVFAPFHTFGEQHGKRMIIAEWGGREDPAVPGRKATWIDEASTQLKRWTDIAAVLYYDADNGCSRWVDSSASSLASFRAMGADPYFAPPPSIQITAGPDVYTSSRSATLRFSAAGAAGYRCTLDGGVPVACDGGEWSRTSLAAGQHVFSVVAVGGGGAPTTAAARWSWTVVPNTVIDVQDFRYAPSSGVAGQGTAVTFRFQGPSSHTVTDTSGIGLFDTGPMPAGTSASVPVLGAGRYPFACEIHPSMTGALQVGLIATPLTGTTTTSFTLRWSKVAAPTGFVFDVQVKRPGSTTWKPLVSDSTAGGAIFTPDRGIGSYSFRARTQRAGGAATMWSVAGSVSVG
jgi:plastocyanin